eukprot:IDg7007t1
MPPPPPGKVLVVHESPVPGFGGIATVLLVSCWLEGMSTHRVVPWFEECPLEGAKISREED